MKGAFGFELDCGVFLKMTPGGLGNLSTRDLHEFEVVKGTGPRAGTRPSRFYIKYQAIPPVM